MIIKPCAKINLGLNIVGKRDDGYHDLETVFYPVAIYDEIEIVETNGEPNTCILTIEGQPIKGEASKNLVVKAYRALAGQRTLPAVGIRLKKEIPMEAGMGGGSSDCAYTLRLLNNMFSLGMKEDELIETALLPDSQATGLRVHARSICTDKGMQTREVLQGHRVSTDRDVEGRAEERFRT